jgi:hypothetical protein
MSFRDSIFFSGAISQWRVFHVFRTTIARGRHEVKPQMQGISLFPIRIAGETKRPYRWLRRHVWPGWPDKPWPGA